MNNKNAWTLFWASGEEQSFLPARVDGPIKQEWAGLFESVDNGAILLDLACGNASIASAHQAVMLERDIKYIGVDVAEISTPQSLSDLSVTLHPETEIEALPLKDECVDLVISQFGLEYSDWRTSLKQVSRVLKTGGEFRFLVHLENSAIAENVSNRLKANKYIQELGILPKTAEFVRAMFNSEESGQLSQQVHLKSLNDEVATLSKKLTDKIEESQGSQELASMLEALNDLFVKRMDNGLDVSLKRLTTLQMLNDASVARLDSMLSAMLSEELLKDMRDVMVSEGLTLHSKTVKIGDYKLGEMLYGKKNG